MAFHTPAQFSLTKISLGASLVCGAGMAMAQASASAPERLTPLETIVVSASRVEQDATEIPATITSIGAREIEKRNPSDLEDLFKSEAGVSVRATPNRSSGVFSAVGRAGNEGVNIRGLEGDQVRLQVDGVSLPSTYSSGPYSAGRGDMIDPEGYRRVEIFRGSASAQYGSDGLGGAVTFVTKDTEDLLTLGKALQGNLKVAYTSADDAWQLAPSFAFKGETVRGMVLASLRQGHETDNMGDNHARNASRTAPNPADIRSNYVLAKLQLDPTRTQRFKLTFENIRKNNKTDILSFFGDPFAAATLTDVNVREDISRELFKLDYRYTPDGAWFDVLSASLYSQRSLNQQHGYEARSANPRVRTRDTQYGEDAIGANVQMQTNLGQGIKHQIVWGLDVVKTDVYSLKDGYNSSAPAFVKNKSFPDTDYETLGAFIQDHIQLGAVGVMPGLRYDRFKLTPHADALYSTNNAVAPTSLSDSAFSPKLGATWAVTPAAQLFGQFARGFRAPTASQVNGGVTNLTASDPYTSIGNPNLKPETSNSFEVGLRGHLGSPRNNYSIAVFHNKYKNFIESNARVETHLAPTPDVNQTINRGRVTIRGFEARGEWALSPRLTLTGAYAHAKGDARDADGSRQPLQTIDPDKLITGLRYEHSPQWGVQGQLIAVKRKKRNPDATKYTSPGYAATDVSAWYRFSPATRLNVSVDNLFDKKYVEWADVRELAANSAVLDAYTQPGRNFRISLTHSF